MSFMKHIKTSCKLISVILCAAMLASLCACGSSRADASASAQGTDASITAYGKNAQKAVSDAAGVFSAFNSMLDAGSRTSAMYALNNAGGASVVVPGQIADMLGAARTVYDRSNGALDPTIQPVAALWGFDTGKYAKPTDEQIDAADVGRFLDLAQLREKAVEAPFRFDRPDVCQEVRGDLHERHRGRGYPGRRHTV